MDKTKPELINLLRKFKKNIAARYGIEKMILFGWQVSDTTKWPKDVELLIACREKKKLDMLSNLYLS